MNENEKVFCDLIGKANEELRLRLVRLNTDLSKNGDELLEVVRRKGDTQADRKKDDKVFRNI